MDSNVDLYIAIVFAFAVLMTWDGHRRSLAAKRFEDREVVRAELQKQGAALQDAVAEVATSRVSGLTGRVEALEKQVSELRREMADLGMSRIAARRS